MNVTSLYNQNDISGLSQVELESRALLRVAASLDDIKKRWDEAQSELPEALEKNNRLWTVISTSMADADCQQPPEVKANIANLALFIFKRSIEILTNPKPESLDVIININYNIAKGLSESPQE